MNLLATVRNGDAQTELPFDDTLTYPVRIALDG
jgi:hypothetical protein